MEIEGNDVAYPAKPASTLQSCHFFYVYMEICGHWMESTACDVLQSLILIALCPVYHPYLVWFYHDVWTR